MKKLLLLAVVLGLLVGCVSTETPKFVTISYPLLPYNKIQPPKEGCLTGIFTAKLSRVKEPSSVEQSINYYGEAFSSKPSTFIMMVRLEAGFPTIQATRLVKDNIIPFIHCDIGPKFPGLEPSLDMKDIVEGKYNNYIREYAKGATEFGKKYGGFFFTTMEEMNANWYDWGQSSDFIGAWRHIWQIFEDHGANQYVTWIWAVSSKVGQRVDNPELYYPGDKYVDWISFNAFSVKGNSFYSLTYRMYKQMLEKHPQKPIMVEAFAATKDYGQPRWLRHTYGSIKSNLPAIKAAIYWDNTWTLTGDHRLSSNSLETLKEIFKDPYWLMAK
jgi:hypothetical protein